ncbi:MAG: hypothetical protein IPM57_07520 [Oligoflexia bacterium]|nr:hypothetical protein [Oligoflexia bacterium]
MKRLFLLLSLLVFSFEAIASSSYKCDFVGTIEKIETDSQNSFQVKLQFSRRSLKTWMLGGRVCKDAVGKTLSTIIPSDDEIVKELSFGNSNEITAFMICPDEVPGCFWDWHSYKLSEQ